MNLSTPQLAGLLVSVLGIAVLAVISGARHTAGGNTNSSPIIAGIIMGTLVGGSSTVGTAQLAFNYGLSAWWFTLGGGLACLVLAVGFVGPWRRSGSTTLIGILSGEFGPRVGLAASLLSSVGTFINVISQLIAGTAVIAVVTPDLGLLPALLITAVFMAVYVIAGGAHGAGMVGILKLILLYVSMLGCGVMVLLLTGGLGGFAELVSGIPNPEGVRFGSLFARGLSKDGGAGLSLILGVLTTQTYAQAILSGKSDAAARRGALISAALIPPIGAGGILVGLFMRAVHPEIAAKTALTAFATTYLPPVLSGVLLGTLFIAVVGTGAGLALGIASIVRRDILQRFSDRVGEARLGGLLNKLIILLVLGAAVLLSTGSLGDTILSFAFMSMGLRGAVVFIPMLCALWLPGRVNRWCALAGVIAGPLAVLVCGTLVTLPWGIDPLFAGVAVSLACCTVGLILGRRVRAIRVVHGAAPEGKSLVIALDSEIWAGGAELGRALGNVLGVPCYDEEILERASALSGIPLSILRRYDGRSIMAAYDLNAASESSILLPTTGAMISALMAACRELAEQGSCILVDRFASKALEGGKCIPVFVHEEFELRAAACGAEKGLGPAAARRQLRRMDRSRRRYYRMGSRDWGNARAYAVSVNTAGADPEKLARSLAEYVLPEGGNVKNRAI